MLQLLNAEPVRLNWVALSECSHQLVACDSNEHFFPELKASREKLFMALMEDVESSANCHNSVSWFRQMTALQTHGYARWGFLGIRLRLAVDKCFDFQNLVEICNLDDHRHESRIEMGTR